MALQGMLDAVNLTGDDHGCGFHAARDRTFLQFVGHRTNAFRRDDGPAQGQTWPGRRHAAAQGSVLGGAGQTAACLPNGISYKGHIYKRGDAQIEA